MGFGDSWAQCMSSNSMPVINLDDLSDVKEFIEQIHQAWENAGGEEETTIAALVAAGALTGVDEAALAVLADAVTITVVAYLAACIACMASAGIDALRDLFAQSPPQPFMQDKLADLGIKVGDTATA